MLASVLFLSFASLWPQTSHLLLWILLWRLSPLVSPAPASPSSHRDLSQW
jgi:hypothetical protein